MHHLIRLNLAEGTILTLFHQNSTHTQTTGFGASIAWTPTTTGTPRVIVGAPATFFNNGPSIVSSADPSGAPAPVYGAVYVYNTPNFAYSFLQVLQPPRGAGAPSLDPDFRFGATLAASRSVNSGVLTGSNLFVGAPFANIKSRGDEAVYFYSASQVTQGLTTPNYVLQQTLNLGATMSSRFGAALAVSPDDTRLVVGAPAYEKLTTFNPAFNAAGPNSGRAFVFVWNSNTQAYTMQAILLANQAGPQFANEVGFGVAVAMSGNIVIVGSMGVADLSGQPRPGVGNLYVWTIGKSRNGLIGAASAASVPVFLQSISSLPISNAMALSFVGNYVAVGVNMRSEVVVLLNRNQGNRVPNFKGTLSSKSRVVITASRSAGKDTGMGQIVTAGIFNGRYYLYCGQPTNGNGVGSVYIARDTSSLTFSSVAGVTGGILPGFGASIAFNAAGNYMFAGNFLNQPHALVLSLYFEAMGARASPQRLVSNDRMTQGMGVYSNYGSVIAAAGSALGSGRRGSLVAIGAPLGPTQDGRVYIYNTVSKFGFSLQAVLAGTPGSNFGSAVEMLVAGNAFGMIVGAPNPRGGYVNLYSSSTAQRMGRNIKAQQRLTDPSCNPQGNRLSCGSNFGGSLAMDGQSIVVAAHNFGQQTGTGRVYVYAPVTNRGGIQRFVLAQTLISPAREWGFGVSIALSLVRRTSSGGRNGRIKNLRTINGQFQVLVVGSMGVPATQLRFPFNNPISSGNAYIYVRTTAKRSPWSVLQVLRNVPISLPVTVVGTGSTQAMAVSNSNLYIGTVMRNMVYIYRFNGANRYSLMQTLVSPNCRNPRGDVLGGSFGASLYANRKNDGLAVGASANGTVFFYSMRPGKRGSLSRFRLIRAISAQPNANGFGSAMDFTSARFIIGSPGANIAAAYTQNSIIALPQARPSSSPTPRAAKTTPKTAPKTAPSQPRSRSERELEKNKEDEEEAEAEHKLLEDEEEEEWGEGVEEQEEEEEDGEDEEDEEEDKEEKEKGSLRGTN